MSFFKKHKIITILLSVFILINLYSALPVIFLYFQRVPKDNKINNDIVKELTKNKGDHFAFIVMSDTSSGLFPMESTTLKLVSRINKEDRFLDKVDIDFAINVGDVTFRGRNSHYKNYLKIKDKIKFPMLNVIGNHDDDIDDGKKGMALFNHYCGDEQYAFYNRNSYFIVLDNKSGNLSKEQFSWLEQHIVEGQKYTNTFIFLHKPPFNPYQQSWYRAEKNDWSRKFMKLCQKYQVTMVFSGHEYVARVAEFGGVKYAVSGGAGALLIEAPKENNSFNHYMVVKVNGDYIDYEFRRVNPPIWQYTFIYAWKDLYYFVRQSLN